MGYKTFHKVYEDAEGQKTSLSTFLFDSRENPVSLFASNHRIGVEVFLSDVQVDDLIEHLSAIAAARKELKG